MKNPFSPDAQGEMKLNRNVYDLGRNSVFTTDFFKLYPFFCQEVIPGDSVQLDAQVGIRGMPTVFPVQTRCRISMEYYYVRNRTLMDNFEDFIFKTKDVEHPWLLLNNERAKQMISVGSLGDAFGVPSTVGTDSNNSYYPGSQTTFTTFLVGQKLPSESISDVYTFSDSTFASVFMNYIQEGRWAVGLPTTTLFNACQIFIDDHLTHVTALRSFPRSGTLASYSQPFFVLIGRYDGDFLSDCRLVNGTVSPCRVSYNENGYYECFLNFDTINYYRDSWLSLYPKSRICLFLVSNYNDSTSVATAITETSSYFVPYNTSSVSSGSYINPFYLIGDYDEIFDATDDRVISQNPFVGSNPRIRLNSLLFRAYEQVCNYYYRNDKNNPYILDGEAQYNEFIPTHADGPDTNVYDFHYRNWELDRFTSAVQSPQFGEAPLVGLTYSPTAETAELTFDGNLDGEPKELKVTVGVNSEGDIDSIVDFDKDIPSANLRRLSDSISAGISINDLRITNSFQRFLENVLRRGLRYRNQLKSHFGTSVDYPDIDVPQYIGGASSYLDSGQVTNMADSPNAGLGDYVGTLQGGIATRNKIHCYCPEHGWIIGIMSIAPIPSYPQTINKSLIKTDAFDYFLPEFGKIGYVPIHYSELMPLQLSDGESVDDVFGYQKAWYDYMQSMDEVHGDFRTSLKEFVLTRTFNKRPELSESFTVGHPEQLNDIWVANNIADAYGSNAKFMCSSHVSCIMKRPIPLIGTPSLE